jgi:ATP-dependent exoDNAse (exonuclease V) beta subunit
MTVHQAKGLQFDIVVLPELEGQLAGQPPTIVAGRDRPTGPITRVCRYAAEDVRSLLPREFRAMFDVALAERANEALCVLYVALTRAVHELRLIVAPSLKNEKAPPGTYAGLLRAALTDGQPTEPEAVLFEHGDPHWHETTSSDAAGERDSAAGAPTDTSDDTIHVRLAPDPVRRGRGLLRQSPSGSEGGGWVSLPRLLRLDASVAMSRGTLIHKWFEQIEWLDDGDPSDAALRAAAEGLVTPGLNLASELGWFRSMLKRTELRRALSRAAYAAGTKSPSQSYRSLFPAESAWPANISRRLAAAEAELVVERERPFVLRDQTSLLQGTMDRVVWCRAGETTLAADIVDFKTDAVDPSDPLSVKELLALYRPQMDAYRRAVATLTGLGEECVTGRLIFVGSGLVVPV